MNNSEFIQRKEAATPRGVGVMCRFHIDRAQNAELWDVEGNRYLDFAAGIAVLNTGHRHPRVINAVREQLDRFMHTCYQVVPYASYVELAETLNARVPGDFDKKTALFSTGAEAVENAIKVARAATGRPAVIAFGGSFHGRTMMGMALTGKVAPYKLGFGPFPSEVFHAPFPSASAGVSTDDALAAIHALFKMDVDPQRVAAIIFEPVQGEGGFNPAPADFVRGLRAICDQYGILLIADEVQTGFARTGKLLAMEHHDVCADITTMAKSLAGGFPLSAVTGRKDLMDAAAPGGLGGTYAGNPLAVAAALAVIRVIDEERLCERAIVLGDRLKAHLHALRETVPQLIDVRGPGAMIAAEFSDPQTRKPDAAFVKRVQTLALERGLILLTCGVNANVIRFLFPLTIGDAQFAEGIENLVDVMREAATQRQALVV
ncbi:4-aminobutyrate--2-oxoglutarate transaminase [Caballeronia sp. GAWG2-1]|uniref:4-aminobutyrate--2-oxoglutarate transaminase n=1 Tax=Caballeronia sp. GAWG2-1 TaxID=2921744 RepID=UPI002028DDFC|nr:4-aminobutyrate--2-oxoglutarate transaminase [Caballeronia sp. GAWG2-1]